MTDDDLPDLSFFRFERSLYDLTRPLDDDDGDSNDDSDPYCTTFGDRFDDDTDGDTDDDYDDSDVYVDPDDGLDDDQDDISDDDSDVEPGISHAATGHLDDADVDIDVAIDELIRSILDDAASTPQRRTPPRFVDVTRRRSASEHPSPHPVLAERLLEFVYANLDGVSVMIASTTPGTGAYGRLTVDPLHSTEVRLFGWPRLQMRSPDTDTSAIASLLRLGFSCTDGDWVWRAAPAPELVPVAAHAAQRAIAEAWRIPPHEATPEHIRLYALDSVEIMLIASGVLCSWCADSECRGTADH